LSTPFYERSYAQAKTYIMEKEPLVGSHVTCRPKIPIPILLMHNSHEIDAIAVHAITKVQSYAGQYEMFLPNICVSINAGKL
jgi:hypothetical protein